MMKQLYKKTDISKIKISKIKRDILENKYVNVETWEVLDILIEKREYKYKKRKYFNFNIINKILMNLYDKIWATNYWHLLLLIQTMWVDNSVIYENLWLSKQWLKNIKRKFKELNIIKKWKIENKTKYYLNPDYSTYSDKYNKELENIFNKKQNE